MTSPIHIAARSLIHSQVDTHDHENDDSSISPVSASGGTPASPPPSFRSRASSLTGRRLLRDDPLHNDADHELADAFGDDGGSDDEQEPDDRQRLMRADTSRSVSVAEDATPIPASDAPRPPVIERRVTALPVFRPQPSSNRVIPGVTAPRPAADGVFANLSAKPSPGERSEEKPPTYAEAQADSVPPYWETTILAPGMSSDEVYINGLPVGSVFSFIWNGMVSLQLPAHTDRRLTFPDFTLLPLPGLLTNLPAAHNARSKERLSSRPRSDPCPVRLLHANRQRCGKS